MYLVFIRIIFSRKIANRNIILFHKKIPPRFCYDCQNFLIYTANTKKNNQEELK